MPRLIHSNPKYRKHRASGQAVVTLDGRDFYLGPWGSKASRAEYDRLISEWLSNNRRLPAVTTDVTIAELVEAYLEHCLTYYGTARNSETANIRHALGPLVNIYGASMAVEFGPLGLAAIQNAMVERGWCRSYVNANIKRIKAFFRWCVSRELIPPAVHQAVATLPGLKLGRTKAREGKPVRAVADAAVEKTLPHLPAVVGAMVQVQRLTAARPGEICSMRVGDIDRSGATWLYVPRQHKTMLHGHRREIFIGARAQAVLSRYLLKMNPDAYVFSPRESELQRRQDSHARRVTPLSQGNAPSTNRVRKPERPAGERYSVDAYNKAVARACEIAFPPPEHLRPRTWMDGTGNKTKVRRESQRVFMERLTAEQRDELGTWRRKHRWHVHQLRHSSASEIRRRFGLERVSMVLGHASTDMAELYAQRDSEAAREVIAAIG